jgi:hypothetical protein
VEAVVAQQLGLSGSDAVQGVDRQRGQPVGDLVRGDGQDAAG